MPLGVRTEWGLQRMSRLGAPARGVDIWVVSIDPEVIAVTPTVKVELWRECPWRSAVPCRAQHGWEALLAPGASPHPTLGPVRSKILDRREIRETNHTMPSHGQHNPRGFLMT